MDNYGTWSGWVASVSVFPLTLSTRSYGQNKSVGQGTLTLQPSGYVLLDKGLMSVSQLPPNNLLGPFQFFCNNIFLKQ